MPRFIARDGLLRLAPYFTDGKVYEAQAGPGRAFTVIDDRGVERVISGGRTAHVSQPKDGRPYPVSWLPSFERLEA